MGCGYMKIKLKYFVIAWVVIFLLMLWAIKSFASFDNQVDARLSGGVVSSRSMALWEIYKYKYTDLLRKSPMCYCPFKAYLVVGQFVKVEAIENEHCLSIGADLKKLLQAEADFNVQFAKAFKATGTRKRKIRKIYNYCSKTRYVAHIKTAKEVFSSRCGDCAGITAAFYVLCKVKKIPVRYVIGWGEGSCHAWNRVKLSGKWYWVDCTLGRYLRKRLWDGFTIMEYW